MRTESGIAEVRDIMLAFADQTGLSNPNHTPRRYLWTDAHAVCNFLSLFHASGEVRYRDLSVALIEQVHSVLGRHRPDDARQGWISGLDDEAGRAHPTAGGLRIGKALGERRPADPIDERLEWERDGQYFHYLTKWMHALSRAGAVTGNTDFETWAIELARTAYAGFAVPAGDGKRLYWKMSIDLSYPLVASSGHHDPLDGYVTFAEISGSEPGALTPEIGELASMLEGGRWSTTDPLGIGGLLFDASRVVRLTAAGRMDGRRLASQLLAASIASLAAYSRQAPFSRPAHARLAFRELGLSIGLRACEPLLDIAGNAGDGLAQAIPGLEGLHRFAPLADAIEAFWRNPGHQRALTWREHGDINAVMLATSMLPDEFVEV